MIDAGLKMRSLFTLSAFSVWSKSTEYLALENKTENASQGCSEKTHKILQQTFFFRTVYLFYEYSLRFYSDWSYAGVQRCVLYFCSDTDSTKQSLFFIPFCLLFPKHNQSYIGYPFTHAQCTLIFAHYKLTYCTDKAINMISITCITHRTLLFRYFR